MTSYTAGAQLNTDDHPRIEFNAPRNLYSDTTYANQESIVRHLGGAEMVVPVRRMAVKTSNELKAPALGLAARIDKALVADNWQASWRVERQLLSTKKKGTPRVVVASHALLTWQEGRDKSSICISSA